MTSVLVKMSVEELKSWLRAKLGSKWSERDFSILTDALFNKTLRTDREYFARMLTRGKISKGISLED